MHGFLWPTEVRKRWWLRIPAAIAAAMTLLLAGFVVGATWAVLGVWPTHHILVPLAQHVFNWPYIGPLIILVLIGALVATRFSPFLLIALLFMPFSENAKLSSYLWSFIPFMFHAWLFATMYIVYH